MCPGCHNPQSWDFSAGKEMNINEIVEEVDRHRFNVTFSGGDPLYQLPALIPLAKALRGKGYTIWCYTGFRYEEAIGIQMIDSLLENIEVLVDGPFIESAKDLSLLFRGSSNQRLIDMTSTTPDDIHLWLPSF
jgi:anaerobic ribonucleoside-triphosphate reductase activating protein